MTEITKENYNKYNQELFDLYESKFAVIGEGKSTSIFDYSVRFSKNQYVTKANKLQIPEHSLESFIYLYGQQDKYYFLKEKENENGEKYQSLESIPFPQYWLNNTKKYFPKGKTFNPNAEVPYHFDGYYNTFNFDHLLNETNDKSDNWEPEWLKLYRDVVFKDMKPQWDYIIRWIAHRLQNPGKLPKIGLLLTGTHGVGKDVLFLPLLSVLGPHATVIKNWQEIFSKNNENSANRIFLHVTENNSEFTPEYNEQIKIFVDSEEPRLVADKWVKNHWVDNYHGLSINMNNVKSGFKLAPSERRWVVINFPTHQKTIDVRDKKQELIDYWTNLVNEVKENTGWFYDYLINYDLSGWSPQNAPYNNYEESLDLIRNSLEAHDLFVLNLLNNDIEYKTNYTSEEMTLAFNEFCKINSFRATDGNKLADLFKSLGADLGKFYTKVMGKSKQVRGWILPELSVIRENFEEKVMKVWSI